MQIQPQNVADTFWRIPFLMDVLSRAGMDQSLPEWRAVDAATQLAYGIATVREQGPSASSAMSRVIDLAAPTLRPVGKDKLPFALADAGRRDSVGDVCCPETFEYPVMKGQAERHEAFVLAVQKGWTTYTDVTPRRVPNTESPIAFHMDIRATFREGGAPPPAPTTRAPDDPPPRENPVGTAAPGAGGMPGLPPEGQGTVSETCKCYCCRFLQVVVQSTVVFGRSDHTEHTWGFGSFDGAPAYKGAGDDGVADGAFIDCSRVNTNPDPEHKRRMRPIDGAIWHPVPEGHIDCLGDRMHPGSGLTQEEFALGKVGRGSPYRKSQGAWCTYDSIDEPYHDLEPTTQGWEWIWQSIGLIVDTCADFQIRRWCFFEYRDQGRLARGIQYDPDAWTIANCITQPSGNDRVGPGRTKLDQMVHDWGVLHGEERSG
jgi:hypothetical protein